jgi:hypothetical protein
MNCWIFLISGSRMRYVVQLIFCRACSGVFCCTCEPPLRIGTRARFSTIGIAAEQLR